MPAIANAHFHGPDWRQLKADFKAEYERLFHADTGGFPDPHVVAAKVRAEVTVRPRPGEVDRWDVTRRG